MTKKKVFKIFKKFAVLHAVHTEIYKRSILYVTLIMAYIDRMV